MKNSIKKEIKFLKSLCYKGVIYNGTRLNDFVGNYPYEVECYTFIPLSEGEAKSLYGENWESKKVIDVIKNHALELFL